MPMFYVTRVVRSQHELDYSNEGATVGTLVDRQIREMIEEGAEIMDVRIAFNPDEPDDFANYAQYMQQGLRRTK